MYKLSGVKGLRRGVTLADVAKAAGVDQSTVSRVLRDSPGTKVTPETRERIRHFAAELGYVPNATARSLAVRSTSTIALLIPNVSGFIYADIIRGASDAARELGYVLVVADASELGHASDAIRRLALEGRVDGLLLASGIVTDEAVQSLVGETNNIVVLNRQIGGRSPRIIEDDEMGMYCGVLELIENGHTRIGFLAGPPDVDTSRRRIKGYRRAMAEAGLPVSAGLIVHAGFDESDGYRGMQALLERKPQPTAVAAASVAAAVGAMAAARDAGLDIPKDISMVAFHDAPLANYLFPPLTTVAMPLKELGRQAMLMLHGRLIGESGPMLVKIQDPAPKLVRRQSVAAPRS